MKARALLRISRTVADLAAAEDFYRDALGFTRISAGSADPAIAALLGVRSMRTVLLQRGSQTLELAAMDPPGAPYPIASAANDGWMQHCALVTDDMVSDYARLCGHDFVLISRGGPQTLPGGIRAVKFRDPDGHPVELIQFPRPPAFTAGGIDHTAISIGDAAASVGFYADLLGLTEQARQVNQGRAQDALDGLDGVAVDVVALAPAQPAPHLELLGYRSPRGRRADIHLADIAADRTVFLVDTLASEAAAGAVVLGDGTRAALVRDPDGHVLILMEG